MKHVPRILGRIDFGERVIYRGHADDGWELKASIGRNYTGAWDTVAPREQQALEEFKKRSIPYIRHRPATDIEWLCLMQHHGCATRLLDFTSNPLIALFFASEQVEGKDGKDGKLIIAKDTPPYPGTLELSLFDHLGNFAYLPPHITERIIGQAGCFVFCGKPNHQLDERQFEMIPIPWIEKQAIRWELKAMGISYSTLFPGIDGVCRDINESLIYDLGYEEIPF